ncbi:hypothetical protein IF188_05055 [Microbacterium sp. NEAU-LLC]|uniref:DUF2946 domain-containing protein n=1 Tax=Microbacterium helvum TaxID=2773713 RepID=A0ABR8NK78_9MICO|nr:DUF6153 family protein [Microbacterium helvum]MBD3941067.1 hypothetical protein [Microbacterium helvum]
MPHPPALPSSRLGAAMARLLLAAALIAGLLGMHVLMSPSAHAGHAAPPMTLAASETGSHDPPMPDAAFRAEAAHTSVSCATSACADLVPASDEGVWAVVCVLALLLTAVFAARLRGFRRLPRSASSSAEVRGSAAADRGPRHPPSLIVLSISRT